MKICSRCKEEKSLKCFGSNERAPDGLMYWCRECVRIRVGELRHGAEKFKKQVSVKGNDEFIQEKKLRLCIKCGNEIKSSDAKLSVKFAVRCEECRRTLEKEEKEKFLNRKQEIRKEIYGSETKVCIWCGKTKFKHEFRDSRVTEDGLSKKCDTCSVRGCHKSC